MYNLSETQSVSIVITPVSKAGNFSPVSQLNLQVDTNYLQATRLSEYEWLLTPTGKLGETSLLALADEVTASIGIRIVTTYKLEFVFEDPVEKTKIVSPDRAFVVKGNLLEVDAEHGLLTQVNRIDLYGRSEEIPRELLVAQLCQPPVSGHVELEDDGSFIYFV